MPNALWNPAGPVVSVVATGVPWLAAVLLIASRRHVRIVGFTAALVSVVASVGLLLAAPAGQSLREALMALFSCLTLASTMLLPKRDCDAPTMAAILFILGATLLAYATDNLAVFLAGWILTTVPFLHGTWFAAPSWRPRTALSLSSLALGLAIALIFASGHALSIEALKGQSPGGMAAFGLLVAAVILRKGICPAQAWRSVSRPASWRASKAVPQKGSPGHWCTGSSWRSRRWVSSESCDCWKSASVKT